MVERSSIKVQSKDSLTGYKSTQLHTWEARYVILICKLRAVVRTREASSYGLTASLRRVNRQPLCIGDKENEGKNMQNGQGYDNNHTIRTEFESVRNPVEGKLTDASLLRTWAGTMVRVVRSKISVGRLHILHMNLHYCI